MAVGDTSSDYTWIVDIPVPLVLDGGAERITAVSHGFTVFDSPDAPLEVTSDVVEGAAFTVIEFEEDADLREAEPAPPRTDWSPLLGLIAGITPFVMVAVATSSRGHRPR